MSTMPPTEAIPALQTFCMPLMEQVHTLAAKAGAPATKAELQTAGGKTGNTFAALIGISRGYFKSVLTS